MAGETMPADALKANTQQDRLSAVPERSTLMAGLQILAAWPFTCFPKS